MTTTPIVLVTAPQYDKGEPYFSAQEDIDFRRVPVEEEGLADAVIATGASAVIVGTLRYRDRLYDALQRTGKGCALIARLGVGHDGIDKVQCRAHGIKVTNTPGVLETTVAELTVALLGCLARQVAGLDAGMKAGRFQPRTGVELRGKRLAIIGFGAIGRWVARGAHGGYGMRVTAVGQSTAVELERREGAEWAALLAKNGVESYTTDLDLALEQADVVSLHLPALPSQRALLDHQRLGRMKKSAFLVNTARGSLVDEVALFDALFEGRLAGAALDVYAAEPYVPAAPDKDLRTLPNVICTPHVGSNTFETNLRMAESAARNARYFLAGKAAELNLVS